MSGGNAAELRATAAKLAAASAPVLSAIAKAQPLINPETLTSNSADAWSAEWQAMARSVVTYLAYVLPGDVQTAVTAAVKAEQSKSPAGAGSRQR
jgi:hypothetical protein